MSRARESTSGSQIRGHGRGRGNKNHHGGAHGSQQWDLPTDFNGEGSGFQRRGSKRRRRNTGTTVSHVLSETEQSRTSQESTPNDYNGLSTDDKLSLILSKLTTNETHMSTLQHKFDTAFGKGGQMAKLEKTVQVQSDRLTALEYRSIDIEARSRRNNLLFKGFPEDRNENCAATISDFIKNRLMIADEMSIQRVHRLGQFNHDRDRFIIVAFTNYTDTESILAQAYKLKGSTLAISRDYPAEIVEARKALWQEYRDLRAAYQNDKIFIAYPATLKHNGRVVRDMFPDWNTSMRKNRAKPASSDDRHAHGSRDQAATRKPPHRSVYEESTDNSPGTSDSDSESDERMVTSSASDKSQRGPSVNQTQTQTLIAEVSSQAETQPNHADQSYPGEPESPSIIRDGLPQQQAPDPGPPPVFDATGTDS